MGIHYVDHPISSILGNNKIQPINFNSSSFATNDELFRHVDDNWKNKSTNVQNVNQTNSLEKKQQFCTLTNTLVFYIWSQIEVNFTTSN